MGCKLLNYLFEKTRIIHCPQYEQTWHIFYQLLAGTTEEEKEILQLHEDVHYQYIPRKMAATGGESNQFKQVKQAMKVLGITKKYQARIWQLLACLLHLGQLEFISDNNNKVQEAAIVKNTAILDLCADFLGVDPRALENVLTYKTQLIKKDITTMILDSQGASKQRHDIVKTLYSLLFTWLVEHMNTKLCHDQVHNFIGILDLPGPQPVITSSLNSFCVNLANERLHNFMQRTIFELDNEEYQLEGLSVVEIPYFSNQACIELLTRPKHGLLDIINLYSSTTGDHLAMLTTFNKYNNSHASFTSKTGQQQFSIQHFAGQVNYDATQFIEANRDNLNADLVQLIRGNETTPASYNSFLLELFSDTNVKTEHHPKQTDAILNAQQPSGPLRGPSMRRSKSTKRTRNSTLEPTAEEQEGLEATSKKRRNIAMVLSQLSTNLNDLFTTLDETVPWFILCLKPNDHAAPNQFDTNRVRAQIRAFGIPQLCQKLAAAEYTVSYFHDEFLNRYNNTLVEKGLGMTSGTTREQCEAAISLFAWPDKQAKLDVTKVIFANIEKRNTIY